MRSLSNKTILITGASSGIGQACAELLAAEGANLILCARRIERVAELANQLKQNHRIGAVALQLDVREQQSCSAKLKGLPDSFRNIDILINNAGLAAGKAKAQEADLPDWEEMIDTNIKGMLYFTRMILPGMIERNSGHIVNIGSIAGLEPYGGGSVYCATKSAVKSFSAALRIDLLGTAIRVSNVQPGFVETEFSLVRFKGDQQQASQVYQGMKPLTANDIAETILFCITRPAHVDLAEILIMPTDQASATQISRS